MRRIIFLVLLVLVLATTTAVASETKGLKTIGNYPVGEFAIKGLVEHQLNLLVKEIKESLEKGGGQLQITVIGSADTTGSSVSNDQLAKDRAEQVAAVLSANFPNAKIVSWSKGDAENIRQVRVEYKIIPVPVTALPEISAPTAPTEIRTVWLILSVAFILLSAIFFFMRWIIRPKRVAGKVAVSEMQWIHLEVNDEKYSVQVELQGRMWYSPFTSRSGVQICRDSKRGIIESLKGCLKKDEFKSQRDGFIRSGKIRIL